ncbi:MAG: hypothetical protein IPK83_11125 [Planctomycetes bacterium]|nr:hypothetical protein [Planctomycetota bacterium]
MKDVEDIRRAMAIFDDVCDLPSDKWAMALDQHCDGDSAMRAGRTHVDG